MSYRITRRKKQNKQSYCYSVINTNTRKKFSKCTTKSKATRQLKLLNAIRFNRNFATNSRKRQIEKQKEHNEKKLMELHDKLDVF
jgi:hypothetical protein